MIWVKNYKLCRFPYTYQIVVTWLCRYNESIELSRYLILFKDPKWAFHLVTLMLRSAVRATVQFIPCDQICKFAREVCEGGWTALASGGPSSQQGNYLEIWTGLWVRTVNPQTRRSITKFTKNEINKEPGGGILQFALKLAVKVDLFWQWRWRPDTWFECHTV